MEVVNVDDAFDLLHGLADVGEVQAAGGAFEEDVEGFADDAEGAVKDHGGDEQGEERVDPLLVRHENTEAAEDDGGGGEGVAEHVEEDAADVDVAGELPEESGDGAVHDDAGGGDHHHEARLDGDGLGEAVDGGDGDPAGEDHEGEGVDEGGEDAGALVAEGVAVRGGAGLEVDGDEAEGEGEEVRDVVAGLGDEREGVGAEAEEEGRDDVEQREHERELEDALHVGVRGGRSGVDVHFISVFLRLILLAGRGVLLEWEHALGAHAEAAPAFGDDDAVAGVAGVVADLDGLVDAEAGGVFGEE